MASTTCAHCDRYSHFTNRWGKIDPEGNWVAIAATCDNCGRLSVGMGAYQGSSSYYGSVDSSYYAPAFDRITSPQWWPRVGVAPQVEDVPDHIARAARQAHSSASIGNNMAAILMARTVIEATAKDKGITTGNLATKIDALRDEHFIRPAIAEQAHEVRFAGNDMAHGDINVEPTAVDAEEILALMSEVLREVFQGPAALQRIRAKRQNSTV